MITIRRVASGLFAIVAVSLLLLPAGTSAAAQTVSTASAVKHCTTEVQEQAKTRELVIVSQACSTGPQKDAVRAAVDVCTCETLLVTYYQNEGLTGYSDDVYGKAGTCDNSGYGLRDLTAVNSAVNGISSYLMHGSCTVGEVCLSAGFGTCSGPMYGQRQVWVGARYNDNVHSGWVWLG